MHISKKRKKSAGSLFFSKRAKEEESTIAKGELFQTIGEEWKRLPLEIQDHYQQEANGINE